MPSLYIAANQVTNYGGHLQIVYASGSTWSGSTLTEVEVQSPNFTTLGNWDYRTFNQPYSIPGTSGGYGALPLASSQTAQYVWELIGQIHKSMKVTGADLDYIALTQNSNSFIKTVLYVIGNDQDWSSFFSPVITGFAGWGRNVLFNAELGWTTTTGIALNLAGTAGNDIIRTGNGNDTLGGAGGNDSIRGGAGNDTIRGGEGNDTLYADNGRDFLYGDQGTDHLYGGTDSIADVFVFALVSDSVVGTNSDKVYNFSSGTDDIDLSVIDSNSTLSGNQTFSWGGITAKANGIWISLSAGSAIVNGDVNGDGKADFQIQLVSVTSVAAGDFLY